MLEKEGWAVAEAENGRVALEASPRERPGLILLDLMMPEMDGFELVAEMRRPRDWRSIPIVVVTAKDLTAEDRQRLTATCEKILQKGAYNREELLAEVRELVAACVRQVRCAPVSGAARKTREAASMPKILLVEDNEMNRDMLSRRLERKGYEVVIAVDGEEGVELARARGARPHPDGHEPAGARRLGGDPAAQGRRRDAAASRSSRSRRTPWPATAKRRWRRAATTTTRSPSTCRACWARSRHCCQAPPSAARYARLARKTTAPA